jgi:hypothetical protein
MLKKRKTPMTLEESVGWVIDGLVEMGVVEEFIRNGETHYALRGGDQRMKIVEVELLRNCGGAEDAHPTSDSLSLIVAVPRGYSKNEICSALAKHYAGDQANHIPIDMEVVECYDVDGVISVSGRVVCDNHGWEPQQLS